MIKNIIFDLDGTLWDASAQIATAWCNVLKENNISKIISQEDIKNCLGKTGDEICEMFFSDIDTNKNILHLCEQEEINVVSKYGASIYAGVLETLVILSKKYNLYIVSNCQKGYIESFLKYFNIENLFVDYISYGDTQMGKSENISYIIKKHNLSDSVYIGDTIGDYTAATKNKLEFIFAEYGFGSDFGAKYTLKNFDNILNILKEINNS